MHKNHLVFAQSLFPFIKQELTLDLDKSKVKVQNKSLFKQRETYVDLAEIHENTQRIHHQAVGWLAIAVLLTLGLIIYLAIWHLGSELPFVTKIVGASLLSISVIFAWSKFINGSYDLLLYYSKYSNLVLFRVFVNKPSKVDYERFIAKLNEAIADTTKARTLRSIMTNIPTHTLVQEFSISYIEELVHRGIDVSLLLVFLQKRVINGQSAPSHPNRS